MPQLTPALLKEFICQAVPDRIGTYTYSNGFITPAIAVGNIPNDVRVEGIEVIIPNFPLVPKTCYTTSYSHREERWKVDFILHGTDKGAFYTAIDRMFRFFPRISGIDIPINDALKSLPRYQFTIRHSDGYLIIK